MSVPFLLELDRDGSDPAPPTQAPSDPWLDYATCDAAIFGFSSPDDLVDGAAEDYFSASRAPFASTTSGIRFHPGKPGITRSVWLTDNPPGLCQNDPAATPAFLEPTVGEESPSQQGWAGQQDTDSFNREVFPPTDGLPPRWFVPQESKQSIDNSSSMQSSPPSPAVTEKPATELPRALKAKAKAKPQLRTSSRKQRRTSSGASVVTSVDADADAEEPGGDGNEARARRSHNIVEKQYRNRLNSQFERLLAVLPQDQLKGKISDGANQAVLTEVDDKRISKAEVLDMAMRRIKALEWERHKLQKERIELLRGVESMGGVAYS